MSNVQEVAAQMGVLANYIKRLLDELATSTQQSLNEWASDAEAAYKKAKADWDVKCDNMANQATQAQRSLSEIHDNYANAEFQGLGLWGG
jgi:uncharacterized protein YukE